MDSNWFLRIRRESNFLKPLYNLVFNSFRKASFRLKYFRKRITQWFFFSTEIVFDRPSGVVSHWPATVSHLSKLSKLRKWSKGLGIWLALLAPSRAGIINLPLSSLSPRPLTTHDGTGININILTFFPSLYVLTLSFGCWGGSA